jgi:IS1 family transposase
MSTILSAPRKFSNAKNTYVIAIMSREPRQFLGILASYDKSPQTIEQLVWDSPHAEQYYSDGYLGYKDVIYPGKFTQNSCDKDDTYTVESGNADLRTFIPTLTRRSRCFPRKIENLNAALKLYAYCYALFGQWKAKNRIPVKHKSLSPNKRLRQFRYPRLSHLDFLFTC